MCEADGENSIGVRGGGNGLVMVVVESVVNVSGGGHVAAAGAVAVVMC